MRPLRTKTIVRSAAVAGVAAALGVAGVLVVSASSTDDPTGPLRPGPIPRLVAVATPGPGAVANELEPAVIPSAAGLRSAWDYAQERGGAVSFAVVDSLGHLRSREGSRLYSAASVVKAMLLAAELHRLAEAGSPVDEGTDSLLSSMIRFSDNGAADAIHARVGDEGMFAVAERAGMRGFTEAGHWGNAQIAADDLALFFHDLDAAFPRRHAAYAKELLGSVIPAQSWGIPEAAADEWGVRFKGGWLPDKALVHQAAELRERGGTRQISIAVLTDAQPSFEYGVETVRGVAERLLER